jgi:hypothetical protein
MASAAPQPLRDAHGFAVNPDFAHLSKIYAPLHEREEKERVQAWDAFLSGAAAALGLPPGGSAAAAADAALPRVLGDPSAPPALAAQLSKAVHGGVPRRLRPVVWPLLLRARRGGAAERYPSLLAVVEAPGGRRMRRGGAKRARAGARGRAHGVPAAARPRCAARRASSCYS